MSMRSTSAGSYPLSLTVRGTEREGRHMKHAVLQGHGSRDALGGKILKNQFVDACLEVQVDVGREGDGVAVVRWSLSLG